MANHYSQPFLNGASSSPARRFEVKLSGVDASNLKKYKVSSGTCFRTFSYDTGNGARGGSIPIAGLESGFEWGVGEKVYLEFDISQNLQVTGARVKCSSVGSASSEASSKEPNVAEWADFPNMFRITPQDQLDGDGYVFKRAENKRQTKAYLLLATRSDDGDGNASASSTFRINGKVDSNIIMMISQVSGVPVVFPMPWFGSAYSDDNLY